MDMKGTAGPAAGQPEIDLATLFRVLRRRALPILAGGLAAAAAAAVFSLMVTPVYRSEAVIAPRQAGGGGSSSLISQLGGLGGMVSSQFGMSGSGYSLERLEVVLKSRNLAQSVLDSADLLPRLFPEKWNGGAKAWKQDKPRPSDRDGVDLLRAKLLSVTTDSKRQILTIRMDAGDSLLAAELVNRYLQALGRKIKADIRTDADSNKNYLETQLLSVSDPVVREKILNLIGLEIEKATLVSSKSFDILESPEVPKVRSKPRRTRMVIVGFLTGLILAGSFAVLRHSFSGQPERGRA